MRKPKLSQMLDTIAREAAATAGLTGRGAFSQRVMAAMAEVPREEFVPSDMRPFAYADNALPIGEGQTISQPYMVALMTDLLDTGRDQVILEVGTGSGYQAAVLATLVRKVYSLEILPNLARQATARLQRLTFANVEVCQGDGYHGLPGHAPYDGIIVTAAVSHVPQPLLDQLKPGGNLVVPIGLPYMHQELMLAHKDQHGRVRIRSVLGVAFVPLTGEH